MVMVPVTSRQMLFYLIWVFAIHGKSYKCYDGVTIRHEQELSQKARFGCSIPSSPQVMKPLRAWGNQNEPHQHILVSTLSKIITRHSSLTSGSGDSSCQS